MKRAIHSIEISRLMRELNITKYAAVGIVSCLWSLSRKIHKYDALGIALFLEWPGDPQPLFDALVRVGILLVTADGVLGFGEWMFLNVPKTRNERMYAAGGVISRSLRALIFKRDKYRCRRCRSIEDLSIDHVRPVSRGGTNDPSNLVTLCRSCNAKKGNR